MEHTIENIIKVLEAKEKQYRDVAEKASEEGNTNTYLWCCSHANATHEAIEMLKSEFVFALNKVIYGVEEESK